MEGGVRSFFDNLENGGSLAKSFEYLAPKQIRDATRAVRYGSEGMTDYNGNVIRRPDEFSPMDLAIRVVGFTPSIEATTQEGRAYVRNVTQDVQKRRGALIRRWREADPADRVAMWREEILPFNRTLPPQLRRDSGITMATLQRSLKTVRENKLNMTKGNIARGGTRQFIRDELPFIP